MKLTIYTLAIAMTLPTYALANGIPQQINDLKKRIEVVNVEDQRLTDGTYDAQTGTLTLYTEDMDGDSRRPVVIEGITGIDGTNGIDGANGTNGANGIDGTDFDASGYAASLASVTAIGSLQMMDPTAGGTTWAFGVGGQFDGDAGVAAGLRYGVTDDLSAYATVGSSLDGKGASYGLGLAGRF